MVIAGFWFTVGAIINCAAQDLAMLYIGRILLGFGVGFANQSVRVIHCCLCFAHEPVSQQMLLLCHLFCRLTAAIFRNMRMPCALLLLLQELACRDQR